MNNNLIDKTCNFSEDFFGIENGSIASDTKTEKETFARHILWYALHYEFNVSSGVLSKYFKRNRRSIFLGISKIKGYMNMQKRYKEEYDTFANAIKKACL